MFLLAEQTKELNAADHSRLKELRVELERVKKAKEEYVAAHPEQRNLVYHHEDARAKARAKQLEDDKIASRGKGVPGQAVYGKRSVFWHEVLNPLGYPPPGMIDQLRRESADLGGLYVCTDEPTLCHLSCE